MYLDAYGAKKQVDVEPLDVIPCLLKDTVHLSNCQRPVFSLGVSQHLHQITILMGKCLAQLVIEVTRE